MAAPHSYSVTIERLTGARVTPTDILKKIHEQTERTYKLDNGVPYRNRFVLPGMAIVQSLPVYKLTLTNYCAPPLSEGGLY